MNIAWRSIALMAVVARVASANVIRVPQDCGEGDGASMTGLAEVPLDAKLLVSTSPMLGGPFFLKGEEGRALQQHQIPGSHLLEVTLGPLRPNTNYVVVDSNQRQLSTFVTGTVTDPASPHAPSLSWDRREFPRLHATLDESSQDTVAFLITVVGPLESQTHLARIGSPATQHVLDPRCLARAGVVNGWACLAISSIDVAGNRSAATEICGDLRLPDSQSLVDELMINIVNGAPRDVASILNGRPARSAPHIETEPDRHWLGAALLAIGAGLIVVIVRSVRTK
jgi:hypothetical protein